MVNPVLKWAGGKRKIADKLIELFPERFDSYFEPFLGGAAVFLSADPESPVLGDINRHLTNFYSVLCKSPEHLIAELGVFKSQYDSRSLEEQKNVFYSLRAEFNHSNLLLDDSLPLDELSMLNARNFFILNKLAFNGLYRENSSGQFNVPFGGKQRFPAISGDNLVAAAARFRKAELKNGDFVAVLRESKEGDFVYLDPPYIPLTATASFTSYSKSGFGIQEQERLAESMVDLTDRGVKVMMSNSDTKLTRQIFSAFEIITLEAPRVISSKSSTRGTVSEVVARNYS